VHDEADGVFVTPGLNGDMRPVGWIASHVCSHTSLTMKVALRSRARELMGCNVPRVWVPRDESIETTRTYLHAHLALKDANLAKLKPYRRRKLALFQLSDRLPDFLEAQ
jgi:hypothetical protein